MKNIMDRIDKLQFSNCVWGDGKLYGFLQDGGWPVEIDPKTREVSVIDLRCESVLPFQVDSLIYDEKKIYILELDGRRLLQYDVVSKEFRCLYINYDGDSWGNFAMFTKQEEYIYIFPRKADNLIKIDLSKESIIREKISLSIGEDSYLSCAFRSGNKVVLIGEKGETLWTYDLTSGGFTEKRIDENMETVIAASVFEDNAYLLGIKGGVYVCSTKNYSIKRIRKSNQDIEPYTWGNITVTQKNIWLLPAFGDSIYVLDRGSLKESVLGEYPHDFSYIDLEGNGKYYGYGENQDTYFWAQRMGNYMLSIDKNSGRGEWVKLINPLKKDLYYALLENVGQINEGRLNAFNLIDLLKMI